MYVNPVRPVETAAAEASKRIFRKISQAQQTDDSSPHHQVSPLQGKGTIIKA